MDVNGIASNETQTREMQEPVAAATSAVPPKTRRKRKRNIIIFAVVSVLNVALLALLWTQLITPAPKLPGSDSNSNSSSGLGDMSSPLVGKTAPAFTLLALDGSGKHLSLTSLKGQPVILNFWASWCTGCNEEAPFLQKVLPSLRSQGVTFVGIDGQERASDGQAFVQKHGLVSLNVQDTVDGSTAISYGVTGFPETVFINREGVVVAKWIGPLNDQGLKLEIAKMMRA